MLLHQLFPVSVQCEVTVNYLYLIVLHRRNTAVKMIMQVQELLSNKHCTLTPIHANVLQCRLLCKHQHCKQTVNLNLAIMNKYYTKQTGESILCTFPTTD